MAEVNAKDEALKILQESINEQKQAKEKNEEVKRIVLNDIEEVIQYFNDLKNGKHIDKKAILEDPDLLNNNIHIIDSCVSIAESLSNQINSLGVEYDDLGYLLTLRVSLDNIKHEYGRENFFILPKNLGKSIGSLVAIESFLSTFYLDKTRYNQIITNEIKLMLEEAKNELDDFRILKNIIKNLKTEDYYLSESKKYKTTHFIYMGFFIVTLIGALCISAYSICAEPKYFLDTFDYWFIKISFILVVITLVSFFVKQSSHYQSLADQANQTRLEIQAFPTFVTGIEKADVVAIRKELALKYFGREVDKTAHKDMSNLVSDQMKNTTEMVKAVTEVIKKPGNS